MLKSLYSSSSRLGAGVRFWTGNASWHSPLLGMGLVALFVNVACGKAINDAEPAGPNAGSGGETQSGTGGSTGGSDVEPDADGGTEEPVACLEARDGDPCAEDAETCWQCFPPGETCGGCALANCWSGSWQVLPPPPDCPCGGLVIADSVGQACPVEGMTCKETNASCDAARCVDGTWTAVDVTEFMRCGDGPICGEAECHWSEYCVGVLPGVPDGQTSYACVKGPPACNGERPTCDCLDCSDCMENDDGVTCIAAAP